MMQDMTRDKITTMVIAAMSFCGSMVNWVGVRTAKGVLVRISMLQNATTNKMLRRRNLYYL